MHVDARGFETVLISRLIFLRSLARGWALTVDFGTGCSIESSIVVGAPCCGERSAVSGAASFGATGTIRGATGSITPAQQLEEI
jgi:hypothetical protein